MACAGGAVNGVMHTISGSPVSVLKQSRLRVRGTRQGFERRYSGYREKGATRPAERRAMSAASISRVRSGRPNPQ